MNSTATRLTKPELTLKKCDASVVVSELSHMNCTFDSTTSAAISIKGDTAEETVFCEVRAPELFKEDPVIVSASPIESFDDSTGC